ncbi:MAG TPA: ABC transporter ATP-binding protein [Jatrophihabitans sp.]|nr:ABC transporter ATP-binding protein [Jatrophihabitans sp.]
MPESLVETPPAESAVQTPRIRLRGLRKVFGHIVAVDGIDLDIADGEFFAVLGPSGSGKTTVLRMIAGFEVPTEGKIELGGVDATRVPPFRRDVNTVFQDYALFPHMTVAQNVGYSLKVRRVPRAERAKRVAEALELVRLPEIGSRKPAELSGGQRQRIALARALVNRPRVLLLDEPLGALDLKLREQMQVELKAIQRDVGITFVFVTHDQDEALTLCDRLAVMHNGRIEQVGAAEEVYERPASRFVAEFVGTSNLLVGEVAQRLLGSDSAASIRPEKIHVHPRGNAPAVAPGTVQLDGVVREVVYAGPATRVVVDVAPDLSLAALLLNVEAGATRFTRGQEVTLGWDGSAARRVDPSAE